MARTANKSTTTAKETTANVKTAQKVETEAKKPVNVLADAAETKAKSEEVKPAAETKAAPAARKTTTRRTTTRKTTTRKTAGRKTTVRKAPAIDVKADVFVQFHGEEVSEKNIMKKVVAAWEAEGKKATAIKRVKLYIKPEDLKAYFVINEGLKNASTGAVDL